MANPTMISTVRQKYKVLAPLLHEKARRCWAASEALALGRGGISLVATATELSRPTIRRGIAELQAGDYGPADDRPDHPRVRRPGGGRHTLSASDGTLIEDLKRLIDPATRGDPMSPLLWTCQSTRNLADALAELGHRHLRHWAVSCTRRPPTLLDRLMMGLVSNFGAPGGVQGRRR